jgi:hypothetical protein
MTNINGIASFFKEQIYKRKLLSFFLFSVILLFALNSEIVKDYAYADAYESLWTGNTSDSYLNAFIVGGRPLYGYLSVFIFQEVIHTIADLKLLRIFSILCSSLFGLQLFHFLYKKAKWNTQKAALLSFLVLGLPSFTVFMGWSITYEIPIGLNLAFLAGRLVYEERKNFLKSLLFYSFSVLLIISALSLYQSSATAFLIPFVIHFLSNNKKNFNKLFKVASIYLISFTLYYLIFKYLLTIFDVPPLERSNIDLEILPSRLIWFFKREFIPLLAANGIILFNTLFKIAGSLLLIIFLIKSIYKIFRKELSYLNLVFFIIVLPISYLPNLISVDDWISARTMAPVAVIVLIYQFDAASSIIGKNKYLKYLAIIPIILFLYSAAYNQNYALAGLQAKEYKYLRHEIENIIEENPERILIIRPDYNFTINIGYLKRYYSDEIGLISSSRDWVPIPLINQIIKEEYGIIDHQKSINHPIKSNSIVMGTYSNNDSTYKNEEGRIFDIGKLLEAKFRQD